MKADRLLSIITLLTERNLMSATQLSKILEVSVRTIYRDVETLSMAGIPIYTTVGVNGGIGILDSYKVDKQLFNVNDISTLLLGLNGINKILPNQSLINTSIKIENLIGEAQRGEIDFLNQRIVIDPSAWSGNADVFHTFQKVHEALNKHKVLVFSYSDRMGNNTQREVEAERLIFKSSSWYLEGYCVEKKDLRIFMLQRMSNVELIERDYLLKNMTTSRLDDSQFQDDDIIIAKLCVDNKALHMFVAQYGKGCIVSKGNKDTIIQIPLQLNDWGYKYILGFGDNCECIEPLELREKIEQIIDRMKKKYDTK